MQSYYYYASNTTHVLQDNVLNNCNLIQNDQTSMSINKVVTKTCYTNTNEIVLQHKDRVSESNTIHTKQHKVYSMRQHMRRPHIKELSGKFDPSSEGNTHVLTT